MWADTLLHAEQQHLLRLLLWAGLSIVAATGLAAFVAFRRVQTPFLTQFAIQLAAWGLAIAAIAGLGWRNAQFRDVSGAARLERLLWMNVGLEIGYVAVGVAIAVSGWMLARRMGAVGAGMGIVIQGLALLVIDLQFAAMVSR